VGGGLVVEEVGAADPFEPSAPNRLPCISTASAGGATALPGQLAPGQLAYEAVFDAARLALAGGCEGLVTAPLSKANLHAAGHDYPGHTELLAELCGVRDFAMMLYLPAGNDSPIRSPHGLGVVHTTLHTSLRSVFDLLTSDAVTEKCRLADRMMRRLGAERPRIAVAALNPHGGEGGLFGDEEKTLIAPGVERAKADGVDASGPYPTDTLMGRAAGGEFDAVVAMYHDQGHIALKLLDMHGAVNITCGLPIVRTSVAHGTATDLAWRTGDAPAFETRGMIAAVEAAAKLARSSAT
ncbi:MAG: 4-hydroxythreonine-4-phosphate dehydrogenase PdxA, partial [Planctomycetota bacterium]